MIETVTAVYENGLLRPLSPLNLDEHQIIPEPPLDPIDEILQPLIQAGLLTPPRGYSDIDPLSETERRELADTIGRAPGKPLPEIIIDDRGSW